MFDSVAIEQTPVFYQSYTQTHFERPSTAAPTNERRRLNTKSTDANSIALRGVAVSSVATATVAEIISGFQHRRALDATSKVADRPMGVAEKTQQDRVALLAKKYAGKLDSDASARLEILTQRMRLIRPRVTLATLSKMERTAEEVDEVTDGIAALRAEFGI